jgi:ketosteroid isomerase-like protein
MELQTLLDERDISRALARFARIADSKKFDALNDVFAPDVVFDYGSGQFESGLVTLRALLGRHLDHCGGTQHLIGSRAYVQARHQRVGDFVGPIFDSNGEYLDRWERRPDGWRIVHRTATWATNTGEPEIIAGNGQLG